MISILKYTRPNEIKLCQVIAVPVGGAGIGSTAAAGAAATNHSEYPGWNMHEILDAVGNAKYKMLKALGYYEPIQNREDPRYQRIMQDAAAYAASQQPTVVDTRRGYTPISLNVPATPNYAKQIGQYGDALQQDLIGQRVAQQIQEREALAARQQAALEELHRRQAELGPTSIATSATISLPDYLYGDRTQEWIGLGPLFGKLWKGTNKTSTSSEETPSTENAQEENSTENQRTSQQPQPPQNRQPNNNNDDKNKKRKYAKIAAEVALAGQPLAFGILEGIKRRRTKDPTKLGNDGGYLKYTIPGAVGMGLEYLTRGYDYEEQDSNIVGYMPDGTPIYKNNPNNNLDNNSSTTEKESKQKKEQDLWD